MARGVSTVRTPVRINLPFTFSSYVCSNDEHAASRLHRRVTARCLPQDASGPAARYVAPGRPARAPAAARDAGGHRSRQAGACEAGPMKITTGTGRLQ
jgi:hypothetical protein